MFPLRTILFRLHWAIGLSCGLVLAVIGATGGLLAYEEAIVAFANRDVAVRHSEAPRLRPSALVARIEMQRPGTTVSGLAIPEALDAPIVARFGRRPGEDGRPPSVHVDPREGDILATVRLDEGFATVRALHRWLLIPGDGRGWGRTVTGISALALLVFLATGLYLRWPATHGWRIWLRPRLSRPGRARWWSLHAVVGTWLAPIYVLSVLTGLTWSYPAWKSAVTWLLAGEVALERAGVRMGRRGEARPDGRGLDLAWATFQASEGREAGPVVLTLPGGEGGAIRIRWVPRGVDPSGGYDQATYDAASGALRSLDRTADKPLGRRMADAMLEVHRGRFFGSVPAFAFAVAAVALPGFAATGLALYVLRRRSRARTRPERIGPRPPAEPADRTAFATATPGPATSGTETSGLPIR